MACGGAHRGAQLRIVNEAFYGFGSGFGVVFGHHETCDVVVDNLAEAFGVGGDHRASAGHCLDGHHAEAFFAAQRH